MAISDSRSASLFAAFDQHPDLDAARALLEPLGERVSLPPFAQALHDAGIGVAAAEGETPIEAGPAGIVARSDVAMSLPIKLGLPLSLAPAMVATRVSGPFRGPSGAFWLHFYGPPQSYSIFRSGETRPRIILTQGELPLFHTTRYEIALGGGTVWILASMLDPAWPADAYAGFTVAGGRLTFSAAPAVSGDHITYGAGVDLSLQADLTTPAPGGDACPAQAAASGPDSVKMVWHAGAAPPDTRLGDATVTFTGKTLHLDHYAGPPHLRSELQAIVFPFAVHPVSWDASLLHSEIVSFSDTTALSGGWALSLVHGDASTLTEALGPGFFLFDCADPLQARPASGGTYELQSVVLAVRQGQFVLGSQHAESGAFSNTLRLWSVRNEPDAPRLPLTLTSGGTTVFAYICDSTAGEALYTTCGADLAIDRPVTIQGDPLAIPHVKSAWLALLRRSGETVVAVGALTDALSRKPKPVLIALHNALVAVTEPLLFLLEGRLSDGGLVDGGMLLLTLGAWAWQPTLPDPYVTNHRLLQQGPIERVNGLSRVTAIAALVTWKTPPAPSVSFLGALGAPVGADTPPTSDPTRPLQQSPAQIRVPTQTDEGREPATKFFELEPITTTHERLLLSFQETAAAAAAGGIRGLRLLDVSTRKDLLGVELAGQRGKSGFQLFGLDLCTPAYGLRVFALPQVQWEPVRTLDRDQDIPHLGFFPTPLASVTDGGATTLMVSAQRLVPAIPDLAVDAVISEFASGKPAALLTTLPFGLKAYLDLRPAATPDGRAADLLKRVQPEFVHPELSGGLQLAFIAESGPSNRAQSSYFDGTAMQLRNGAALSSGAPLNISVLGSIVDPADSVQEMFNNQFGPSAPTRRVPVTRLDVSGYGGSCFSEWLDRQAAYASAAKVQFQVLVGRTALEIVKIATVLYPWGVLLTRTVTIERKGGGGVIRRDSGWQAASDGLFQFPGTSYHVQPGLLRGLFAIRNIRSTGLAPITFTGHGGTTVVLAPKFFDAQARIDGLEGASEIPANGVLGFLQIEPVGQPLHEEDLRTLLGQQGAAGGPVEGTVNAGASGFRVRATRVEVGLAEGAGGHPELVGAVRSAPVFRQNGSWAAVRGPGPSNPHGDGEVVNANAVHGLPLVREGELLGVTGSNMNVAPQGDIRFCDPADLHKPDDPVFEYGFLQTSPAHAFLFARPHVDQGIREIRSRTSPRFADVIARSSSKGLFPPAANAIALPPNALLVDAATGGFRLRDAVNLSAPRPPLILAQRGSDSLRIDYSNANLSLSFDQSQWNLDMRSLELWTDIGGISKVSGMRKRVVGGTNTRPVILEVESLLKPELERALTFLPGFGGRPQMGPVDLTATNTQHETQLAVSVERHWKFGEVPGVKFVVGGKAQIGFMSDDAPPPGGPASGFSVGLLAFGEVEGKIPIYGCIYLLLGAEIDIGGGAKKDDGQPWEGQFLFELKAYVGIGIKTGIFDGSLAIGYHLAIENSTVKNGVFGQLQAELDLKVVSIGVEGELGGLWYDIGPTEHPPDTHASDLDGEIQVNVELMFIGFHFSVEFESIDYHR